MQVFALVGSLRASSSTTALARALGRVAPAGVAVEIYGDLAALPAFCPDLDDAPPDAVVALRAAVGRAQALAVVSPEYAHGMPGALKNALDWLVSALEPLGKPVLLVCASPAGAVHAHAQFAEVLRTMSLPLVDGGAHVFNRGRLDAAGEVDDAALLAHLAGAMQALVVAGTSATPD
ncbi:MAG: NADPH-dependent FMN reductase [Kofleriaceae bacterium]